MFTHVYTYIHINIFTFTLTIFTLTVTLTFTLTYLQVASFVVDRPYSQTFWHHDSLPQTATNRRGSTRPTASFCVGRIWRAKP